MSMSAARVTIGDAAKVLATKWTAVKEQWGDEQSRQFETEFITPIDAKVRQAVEAILEFEAEFAAARRACE